jgi:two-component system phosphate regulon sensor histidine kinase PhoR
MAEDLKRNPLLYCKALAVGAFLFVISVFLAIEFIYLFVQHESQASFFISFGTAVAVTLAAVIPAYFAFKWILLKYVESERRLEEKVKWLSADVMSVAAHELRHPATVLKGYSLTLLHSWPNDPVLVRESLESINIASDRLTELVEKLFDASSIENEVKLDYSETDPRSIVEDAVSSFPDHRIDIFFTTDITPVQMDTEKVSQVLKSLLDNALKFSTQDNRVDIDVKQNQNQTIFQVTDRGVGIPSEHLERIFDRFYQVEDPVHHSKRGTGLGLYIAKTVVGAHGGWIKAESENGGSVFSFGIPTKRETAG